MSRASRHARAVRVIFSRSMRPMRLGVTTRDWRKAIFAARWMAVFCGVQSVAFASDDAGTPGATLTCDRVAVPGRVRCEVEARVGAGEAISWGDVVVVDTPPFASALRGRIGPHEATARDASAWRWAFALVARSPGSGDLSAKVRLVVCRGATCAARELPAVGRVVVGKAP